MEDGKSLHQLFMDWWARYAEVEEAISGKRYQEAQRLSERLENDLSEFLGGEDVKVTLDDADFVYQFLKLVANSEEMNE